MGSGSPANIGAGVSFFDGGKGYSAGAAFGSALFGAAAFTYTDFDDTDLSLKQLAGAIGYEVAPSNSQLRICPNVGLGYGFGLEIAGIDITTLTFSPSVSVGFPAEVSPTVLIVPFADLGLLYQRVTADAGPLGEESESETDGALVLGISLLFNARFAVGPSVFIPLASDGGDTVFGVDFAISLGNGS